ncbi:MAG: hypothetical protein ABL927_15240 [Bdellovibrionales bacterium]
MSTKKNTENVGMNNALHAVSGSIGLLDFYFPFFVFFYGLVINFVLEIPYLMALAQNRMPYQFAAFERHRKIAILSLYIGGLWSLQNLWLS